MKFLNILKEIIKLPKIKISIIDNDNTGEVKELYIYFNKKHKKYKIIKNKTIGVMLYELPKNVLEYDKAISGKNGVGYFSRRCKKFGYYTKYFTQSEYLNELYEINTSSLERQGKKMTAQYLKKVTSEERKESVNYFGVFNNNNKLVGYIRLIITPKLYIISKIIGHKKYLDDNIMYLLMHDLTYDLIDNGKGNDYTQYFMYDTYFGGKEGLNLYKKRNCFKPYRVKWQYISDKRN